MKVTKTPTLMQLERMVDFNYWARRLLKLWWAFLVIALVLGFTGYLLAKKTPIKYKSNVTFALDDGNKVSGGLINLASELGMNFGSGSTVFSGDNIYAILKSRRIIESVLLTTDSFKNGRKTYVEYYLTQSDFFNKGKNSEFHFPADIKREELSYRQDSLLKKIYTDFTKGFIKVDRPDKRLSIFQLEVHSPSEEFTKMFTDELMDQANRLYTDLLTQKSRQTLETLEQQAAEMKRNLNASISGKATVQDANLNPAFSKSQIPVTQQQTNIQVYGAAYAEIFKNLEMARFQYLNARPIIQIIDQADYPMDKVVRGKLKTAIIFAGVGCMLMFLILWGRRVIAVMRNSND